MSCPTNCSFTWMGVIPPSHCPHCGRCLGCGAPYLRPPYVQPIAPNPFRWPYNNSQSQPYTVFLTTNTA